MFSMGTDSMQFRVVMQVILLYALFGGKQPHLCNFT